MRKDAELIVNMGSVLGESPCWDHENSILYWVDILGKKICQFNLQTSVYKETQVNQYIGCLSLRKSAGLIVALQEGFHFFNPSDESLSPICNPESHLPQNRFNDGKCDSAGRFWAGTMALDETADAGSLYCLNPDLSVKKVLENIHISNGITWSPDNKVMYFIDSPKKRVVAFDYDLEEGSIKNERTVVTISRSHGIPDGMDIDEEGMLWIAEWNGKKVGRWDPETGELLEVVNVPTPLVTSCTFGGKDLDELFITTAGLTSDKGETSVNPYAGGIFRVKTETRGFKANRFGL